MEETERAEFPIYTWQLWAAQTEGSAAALQTRGPADLGMVLIVHLRPPQLSSSKSYEG